MFSVAFFDDPHAFYEQAHTLWEADETRNNLILGLVLRLQADLHAYGEAMPLMALVRDENGQIGASALMTPPFALIVQSEILNKPALEALADALISNDWRLSGVNGMDEVSDCFAEIWQEKTGQQARRIVNMRAYELRQVLPVDYPSGGMKLAEESDAQLVADMHNAMTEEVILGPRRIHTAESALENIGKKQTFFWVDGVEVVSTRLGHASADQRYLRWRSLYPTSFPEARIRQGSGGGGVQRTALAWV